MTNQTTTRGVTASFQVHPSTDLPGRWAVTDSTGTEVQGIYATHADALSAQRALTAAYARTDTRAAA